MGNSEWGIEDKKTSVTVSCIPHSEFRIRGCDAFYPAFVTGLSAVARSRWRLERSASSSTGSPMVRCALREVSESERIKQNFKARQQEAKTKFDAELMTEGKSLARELQSR